MYVDPSKIPGKMGFGQRIALVISLMVGVSQAQFTGPPAFTALWYRRGLLVDHASNSFAIKGLVANTTLPVIPFRSSAEWNSPLLVPSSFRDSLNYFALNIFGKCSPPSDGTYNFRVQADDGARFFQNGILQTPPEAYTISRFVAYDFTLRLLASEQYLWEVQYFEQNGGQGVILQVEIAGAWQYVDSTWCKPASARAPEFKFGGSTYKVLDGTPPSSTEKSCQGDGLFAASFLGDAVPVESNEIYALATRFSFGASCLIVRKASDRSLFVGIATKPRDLSISSRYCDMTSVTVEQSFGAFRVVGDSSCKFRILTHATPKVSLPDFSYPANTAGAVKSIFFKDATFATLMNDEPNARSAGAALNNLVFALPPGYVLAPNDGLTKAAILGPTYAFGHDCLVLADGTVQNAVNGRICSSDARIDSTSIPGYYAAVGADNAGILIKNPSGKKEDATFSWDETSGNAVPVADRDVLSESGFYYGTVDMKSPSLTTTGECQSTSLILPKGYNLVPPRDRGLLNIALRTGFGSSCLLMSDGSGYVPFTGAPCNYGVARSTFNGRTYVSATSCPALVMMRKSLTTPAPTHVPDSEAYRPALVYNSLAAIGKSSNYIILYVQVTSRNFPP